MYHDRRDQNLPEKVNRVLNIILIALLLIMLRVWHLAVIQYEERLEKAQKPQYRALLEPAKRGTIRDRFNVPLAVNTLKYNATILYSELRQVPSVAWEKGEGGKRVKRFKRREYISRLATLLSEELQLDAMRVEDLIHAKASFYYHMPFVIKEDISEREYYRLKMLEKDWLGIHVQYQPRRSYPQGMVGADVVGYIGAINREEYEQILQEIANLEAFLEICELGVETELPPRVASVEEAKERLQSLREQAYSINDTHGKAGIESSFERSLRGRQGRKLYYTDARGNFLRELPGTRPPLSGQRLRLSISAELQEYAEKLLTQNERIREARISKSDVPLPPLSAQHQPWIKGGAIVALDPKNGEILAMASYPRFDPNDFIPSGNLDMSKAKKKRIGRWLESESHLADIWDQKRPLQRERYDDEQAIFHTEEVMMTWENYLERILPKGHPVLQEMRHLATIGSAIALQRSLDKDLTYDKRLLADLYRLCVKEDDFDTALIEKKGKETLSDYRNLCASRVIIEEVVKGMAGELFHELAFKPWRKDHEKLFLKEKRAKEKEAKSYQKPFTDYLEVEEAKQFGSFWEQYRLRLLVSFLTGLSSEDLPLQAYEEHFKMWRDELNQGAHAEIAWRANYFTLQKALQGLDLSLAMAYLKTMRGYRELDRPLLGRYRSLRSQGGQQLEKHLAAAFYPKNGFGYGRSHTYRQAAPQGSIFKLVTAYAALKQRYEEVGDSEATFTQLNPLEIVDHTHRRGKELYIGYDSSGHPIPRAYKGGRLPRSSHIIGKLDLLRAIETSSNPYFSLLAGDVLNSPEDLEAAARALSYGSKTGVALPAEIPGQIPKDLATNLTGLYATAIGQHTLIVTPLQTALMLAAIANGGRVMHPQIIHNQMVEKWPISLPSPIRQILIESMRRVVVKTHAESLMRLSRIYRDYPEAISDYLELKEALIGKTSTAEMMETVSLDGVHGTNLYKHVWFGGISFEDSAKEHPELVVVIYLRFGTYGKEAAPLAAQMVKKWREIKAR